MEPTAYPGTGHSSTQILKLIVCVAVIVAACVFFYRVTHADDKPLEIDRYGCICDRLPNSATLVFVDKTDPYSVGQIAISRKELGRIHDAIPPGGMVTIASIGGELPAVINFRACSPEKGEVPSFFESLQSNQDWLTKKSEYEEKFEQPIQKLAKEMPLDVTTAHSPIIQSIAGVMDQLGPQWSRVNKRKLTIISDLMENTPAFSHYDGGSDLKRFAEVRSETPYIRDTTLDLRGVEVTVLYLTGTLHNRDLQGLEHQKFWRDLIAFYGGDLIDWIVVPATEGISQ